jgi:hypothetical protein
MIKEQLKWSLPNIFSSLLEVVHPPQIFRDRSIVFPQMIFFGKNKILEKHLLLVPAI